VTCWFQTDLPTMINGVWALRVSFRAGVSCLPPHISHTRTFCEASIPRPWQLSGESRVDSELFAKGRGRRHGLSSAALREGTEWVVIKAICDFGGLTGVEGEKSWQPFCDSNGSFSPRARTVARLPERSWVRPDSRHRTVRNAACKVIL